MLTASSALIDVLELAKLERQRWAEVSDRIRASGHPTLEGDPDPDPKPDPAPDPKPDPKPDPDDQNRAFAEMRRRAEAAEKQAQEAQRKLAERERKEAEEQGRFKELAEKAEQERDEARGRLTAFERQQRVSSLASRLNFRDPGDAHRFLDQAELDDDKAAEQALKRLAKEKPYLVDEPRRTGGPVDNPSHGNTGDDTPAGLERLRKAYGNTT